MIDADLVIIVLAVITVAFIYFILNWTSKSRLKRLLSVINGRISTTFIRGWFRPCLIGNWHGQIVQVFLQRNLEFTDFFINLYVRCSSPSSTIIILPLSRSIGATVPVSVHSKTFLHGNKFKMTEANILVASVADNESQIRKYLNPGRLKLLEDIFSYGFNYFQIHQDVTSECYIRVGYQHMNFGFSLIFKSKCDSVLQPEIVDSTLTKLQEFQTSSLV